MKDYLALVSIPAECEDDFMEQLDALDSYEIEWWSARGLDKDSSCKKCSKRKTCESAKL